MMGFLDMLTLCTARVVCKRFCRCASPHLKALELDWAALEQQPTANLTQFSGLTRLEVSLQTGSDLYLLAHPTIAPVVTHIQLWEFLSQGRQKTQELAHLALLPKLRSLRVQHAEGDFSSIELLPLGLKELAIGDPELGNVKDASPITRFSKLTSLAIGMRGGPGDSIGNLTSLLNLRSLNVGSFSAVGVLSRFTMLTSLTWLGYRNGLNQEIIFHELGHLSGLSQLEVSTMWRDVGLDELSCLARLTGLTCLKMGECVFPESVAGSSALVPLTRLVSLDLPCTTVGVPLLPNLNLEAVQRLNLGRVYGDISSLRRATRLTHLEFAAGLPEPLVGLRKSLAGMSNLRSLSLSADVQRRPRSFRLGHVLQLLTRLTRLEYTGKFRVDSDMEACAALPGLRSLEFREVYAITPACLPALLAMSGLTDLTLWDTQITPADVTPEMTNACDAERLRRGCPRLKLTVDTDWSPDHSP
jgi:hypothetical protein